jgi:hypothetical protein
LVEPVLAGNADNFTAVIVAASGAQIVRALQFSTIGAFLKGFDSERIVAAAHVALGRRGFSLWNGHLGTCLFVC